jgi:hypothetical protein
LRDEEKRKSRNSATCIGMSKGLDQPDQKGRQILRITHPIPLILQEIAEVQQLRRHGDMFEQLVGGCYKAHGQADDTMNLRESRFDLFRHWELLVSLGLLSFTLIICIPVCAMTWRSLRFLPMS